MSKIYYENTYTDENGIEWLSINGDKNHVINDGLKACSIDQIDKAVKCYEKGLFTVEETMEMITKA